MRKTLPALLFLLFITSNSLANLSAIANNYPLCDTTILNQSLPLQDQITEEIETQTTDDTLVDNSDDNLLLSPAEKRKLKQEERSKERQEKEKERLSKKPTFDEFLAKWQPYTPSGNANVDAFCASASQMVVSYKMMSDSINFIKIEVIDIPDQGDGITQAIKITDGNGHARTKESTQAKWTHIGVQIAIMTADLAVLGVSGAGIVSEFMSKPENLLNFSVIAQLRRSIQAINMLTIEARRSAPIIKEQTELMKTLKSN